MNIPCSLWPVIVAETRTCLRGDFPPRIVTRQWLRRVTRDERQ
jgi:hypothetical protein